MATQKMPRTLALILTPLFAIGPTGLYAQNPFTQSADSSAGTAAPSDPPAAPASKENPQEVMKPRFPGIPVEETGSNSSSAGDESSPRPRGNPFEKYKSRTPDPYDIPMRKEPSVKLPRKAATGTIFIVNRQGSAITNSHVVHGCTNLKIVGRDGEAKMITEDLVNDIALIQVPGNVNEIAILAPDMGKIRQGELVVVFGFPLNEVLSSGGNVTPGIVSALTGLGNNTSQIQITAPIQPGSSGSPVLNNKGEVMAVVSMKLSDTKMATATGSVGQNVNFAVSGQILKSFLDIHQVAYSDGSKYFDSEQTAEEIAEAARKWTAVVECWK